MARIWLMSKIVMEACIIACWVDLTIPGLGSAVRPSGKGADKEYQHTQDQGSRQYAGRIEGKPQEQGETGIQHDQRRRPESLHGRGPTMVHPLARHVCATSARRGDYSAIAGMMSHDLAPPAPPLTAMLHQLSEVGVDASLITFARCLHPRYDIRI